jgi:hypothetical protein
MYVHNERAKFLSPISRQICKTVFKCSPGYIFHVSKKIIKLINTGDKYIPSDREITENFIQPFPCTHKTAVKPFQPRNVRHTHRTKPQGGVRYCRRVKQYEPKRSVECFHLCNTLNVNHKINNYSILCA